MLSISTLLLESDIIESLINFWNSTGIVLSGWENYVMLAISAVLFYLAVVKKFEPLLLLPIAFGMFIVNIPGAKEVLFAEPSDVEKGGLFYFLYKGVDLVIFPPIIFLGIGAMTDFGPMIANPKSILLGAAAQIGIFATYVGAILLNFTALEAAAIAIIGGCGRTYGNLRHDQDCAGSASYHSNSGLFVHGAYSCNPAAYNESSYNKKRKGDKNETASCRFQKGKNHFPDCRNFDSGHHSPFRASSYRYADAW